MHAGSRFAPTAAVWSTTCRLAPTLASIWDQNPLVFRIEDPPQGEGISYRLDGNALLTIGEDNPTFLWQTPRAC